jgi:type I restriction enzyme S subunit
MRRYNQYKDSGVEWIGEIPSGWRKSKFKYVSELQTGNSLNDEQKILYESENPDDVPYVSSKDIDVEFKTVNYENGLRIPKKNNRFRVSPKGSFLMVIEGGSSGRKMVFLDKEVCYVNKLCSFNSNENTKFQYYFVQSFNYQDKFKLSLSGLIGGVSISNLREFELILPPLSEQVEIVSYLDTKTSLIDTLIENTQKKIELLKEKRISLISEVVTKGLNPNVEMKDSGVEWIGEIPSHWVIKKTKHIRSSDKFSIVDGPFGSNLKSEHYVDNGEVYIIESGFITSGEFKFVREFKTITFKHFETIKRSECFEGCIIMSKIGEYYGMSGILPKLDKPTVVSGNCISLKISEQHNTTFIHSVLLQHWKNGTFKKEVQQTGQPFISMTMVDNIPFPIPPLSEQQQIVSYLDEQTQLIDKTISVEERRIELLKEYRQSLISEVVTGKRKVTKDE